MSRSTPPLLAVLAVAALLLAACGSDSDGATRTTTAAAADELTGDITVAAAASLTEGFTQLGQDFEALHPDTEVTFNFDSSGSLSDGIVAGAPADVFASADEGNMAKLTDADLTDGDPTVFARNQLVIVTKPGNPEGIEGLAGLVDVGTISLCGEDAPCGKFASQVLDEAGVEIPAGNVTLGQNAKATLTAVTEGDAVAGIVYVTDGQAAGDKVDVVEIPADQNAIATYPIAALRASGEEDVAEAFASYVASDEGQKVLEELGFLAPA
ncbi:molybdate ABC transporter substrate-binding protein [soil metagenome]